MRTILSENFTFNGISSSAYKVQMMRFGTSGFLQEGIIGDANLTEVEFPNDFKPQLQKVSRSPLSFTRQIVLMDDFGTPNSWTENDRQKICGWLLHNEYKSLVFEDRPDIVYYVMATGNIGLNTINEQGYLELEFRTNSPYPWKQPRSIEVAASGAGASSVTLNIDKYLAVDKLYPTIVLERMTTSATLVGVYTAGNAATTFMLDNALITSVNKITINTRNRSIINTLTGDSVYRYKAAAAGFGWMYLAPGDNTIYISQGWKATITYQEPVIY